MLLIWLLVFLSASNCSSSESGEFTQDPEAQFHRDRESPRPDETPRMSGSDFTNLATMVLPDPRDVVDRCVFRYPQGKNNRPPRKEPNKHYHFFFDLEDTIYTRREVQITKYQFLTNFLQKQMGITDEAEIKDLILKRKEKLKQMLEFKGVVIEEPYSFIAPDKSVTALVSSMKANRWVFTKANLYNR